MESKWISVKDRLPEKSYVDVLVLRRNGMVKIGYYRKYDRYGNEVNNFNISDITHWMPLPNPPQP